MPDDEIQRLVHGALDFAKQKAADPQHAFLYVIPVIVGVDVCTVQQEGETIDAAIDRAIRPECLVPLDLWRSTLGIYMDIYLQLFLRNLHRIRVEDVDVGLGLMDVCPICLHNPTIGAQISFIPSCHHAFHSHCVVRWLQMNNSCPLCRQQAYDVPINKF
ncbi:hypothetical protein Pfo_020605 [Paulownia fortunei]|nr:hypothetical protein Pfo_020605 [Paulownia fortunei]